MVFPIAPPWDTTGAKKSTWTGIPKPWDTSGGNIQNVTAPSNIFNQPGWLKPAAGTGNVLGPATPAAPAAPAAPDTNQYSPIAPVPDMTQEDFLKTDSAYTTQIGALNTALSAYLQDLAAQKERYNVDYDNALRRLGFSGNSSILDTAKWDASQNRWENPQGEGIGLNWNEQDPNTASGAGIINQLNDFASRGMLRSSAFARARNNLLRQLNEQLSSTSTARNNAMADFTKQEAAKKQETQTGKTSAANEAIARWKAQYGITG